MNRATSRLCGMLCVLLSVHCGAREGSVTPSTAETASSAGNDDGASAGPGTAPPYAPPMFPPEPVLFRGTRNFAPTFLGRDGTILWLHQVDCDVYLCTAKPPYSTVESLHLLSSQSCILNRFDAATASADGRHTFVATEGGIVHVALERGAPPHEEPIPETGFSRTMAGSEDGGRLFAELDGPATAEQSPGWRAVALFERTSTGWTRELLSSAETPTLAELVGIREDGRAVLYTVDRVDPWGTPGQIVLAEQMESGWTREELDFDDAYRFRPLALTADGTTMLLLGSGSPDAEAQAPSELFISRREDGAWGEPRLQLGLAPPQLPFLPGLSHGARRLSWVEYERADDGNTIVRTRIKMMLALEEEWTWSNAEVVFERDGFFQIERLTFEGDKPAVFSAFATDREEADAFITHAYVVPDVDPPTEAIDLATLSYALENATGSRPSAS